MLTGVIDPAGSAAAEPGQGMVLLRNVSPIRYGIEAGAKRPRGSSRSPHQHNVEQQ